MSATLEHLLKPYRPFWREPGVEEICVNRPGEVWIWRRGKFERHDVDISAGDIEDLAHVAAAQWRRDVNEQFPLLRCDLPDEGRLHVVMPPCVATGRTSLTIRIGDEEWPTLDEYVRSGFFKKTSNRRAGPSEIDRKLADLYQAKDYGEFFRGAVRARKNIIGIGETASGKTRFSKSLLGEVPLDERLITIEDAAELKKLPHCNSVQMYYNKEAKGTGDGLGPTATQLVEASLRMRIGRLFFQELADGQSIVAFLIALMTGHRGAITTLHAADPDDAFDRMKIGMKGTDAGRSIEDTDIMRLLRSNIDIICHFDHWEGERWMSEVWFRPVSTGEIS